MNNSELSDFDNEFPKKCSAIVDFEKQRCLSDYEVGLQERLIEIFHSTFDISSEEIVKNMGIFVSRDDDGNMGMFFTKKDEVKGFDLDTLLSSENIPYTGAILFPGKVSFYESIPGDEPRVGIYDELRERDQLKINNIVFYLRVFYRQEDKTLVNIDI